MRRELVEALRATRRPDGGWPYYAGKSSRLEPTCWSLLALRAAGEPVSADVLSAWPRRDGLLADRPGGNVNYAFNGLAAIALATFGTVDNRLLSGLVEARSEALPESAFYEQDNSIRAWPWIQGTFNWIEPTALVLIALKKTRPRNAGSPSAARIEEAERLLADRVCGNGGWNYGNSNMMGAELLPHVPTTALGLIAMSDKPAHPAVVKSLAWLQSHALRERSAMALGLTRIALGVFGQEGSHVDAAVRAQWHDSRFLDNSHLIAVALYSLSGSSTDFRAFRV